MKPNIKLSPDAYHSESLRARFPEVYEKFFSEHDIVVSVPFTYPLSTGIMSRSSALTIKQRLPLRAYIGLTPLPKNNTIVLGKANQFSLSEEKFERIDYYLLDQSYTTSFIKRYLGDLLHATETPGLSFNFLLESSFSTGFGAEIYTAMIVAMLLHTNKITESTLQEIAHLAAYEINHGDSPATEQLRSIRSASIVLKEGTHTALVGGTASSHVLRGNSSLPFINFSEDRIELNDAANSETFNSWGFFLDEFCASVKGHFPTDVTSISLREGLEPFVISNRVDSNLKQEIDTLREEMVRLGKEKMKQNPERNPLFCEVWDRKGSFWTKFIDGQTIDNLYLLRSLIRAYEDRASLGTLHALFNALSMGIRDNAPFEELPTRLTEYVIEEIKRAADVAGIHVGISKLGWGRNEGNILVFSEPRVFRKHIATLMQKLQQSHRTTATIDYASWRDGWGKDGLLLEQSLAQGVYSPYVPDGARLLRVYKTDGSTRRKMTTDDPEKIAQNFDLLIDHVEEKIFVGGKPCSSKELPTQKVTADILIALLDAPNGTLTNKSLPQSTYTKYRNELTGKVLTPLKKVMRARLKKAPLIRVHGTLYDFSVTLNARGFKIGILS